MQLISPQITLSNLPNLSPFHQPIRRPNFPFPVPHNKCDPVTASAAVKGSGFLSAIGRTIEEEEYRKARAEVNRKGLGLEGYSIEGLSIGGHETCVIVPELKSAFDIGRCPSRAVQQNFVFITHAHLDHIVRFFFNFILNLILYQIRCCFICNYIGRADIAPIFLWDWFS